MTALNLPAAYQPFSKLRIGDNVFEDLQALVTVGGRAPLLIGKGDVPHIWLSIPGSQPEADWFDVIVDNMSPLKIPRNPHKHWVVGVKPDSQNSQKDIQSCAVSGSFEVFDEHSHHR